VTRGSSVVGGAEVKQEISQFQFDNTRVPFLDCFLRRISARVLRRIDALSAPAGDRDARSSAGRQALRRHDRPGAVETRGRRHPVPMFAQEGSRR
jgi:hypothetical protein